MEINKKIIKELKDCLDEFNLNEIEYSEKDYKIKVSKASSVSVNQNIPKVEIKSSTSNLESAVSGGKNVTSPIIGTAYLSPEPGAKKFIEIGKKVKKGDTLMIVEAMKTMNHVPSSHDGVVKEVCVSDGQPVEFGQALIIVE